MEEDIDVLIKDIEQLNTDINKITFDIDGLREEIEDIESKRPFLVRQKALKERQIKRATKTLMNLQHEKEHLDVKYQAFQMAKAVESNPNTPNNTPKEEIKA